MADGSSKPIDQIQIGDLVLATDTTRRTTGPFPVTDVIIGMGVKQLVEISVDADGDGQAETITATDQHPIYDRTRATFIDATHLTTASELLNPRQRALDITRIVKLQRTARVFNLTVAGAHTFYVVADGDSFLTHNQSCRPRQAKNYKKRYRSKIYATKADAERAAKRDAADGGARARYRGECRKGCHVHVDYYNKHGELSRTYGYRFRRR